MSGKVSLGFGEVSLYLDIFGTFLYLSDGEAVIDRMTSGHLHVRYSLVLVLHLEKFVEHVQA